MVVDSDNTNIFKSKLINTEEVKTIIIKYCEENTEKGIEHDWSGGIAEMPEEEEENEEITNKKKEQKINEAMNQVESEFLELKGGSLSATFGGAF